MRHHSLHTTVAVLALLASAGSLRAQYSGLPDTMRIPVIFYDFHPNGDTLNAAGNLSVAWSMNGFEQCNPGLQTGMIQDTLDHERKPVWKATKACNDSMKNWYRPYGRNPSDTFVFNHHVTTTRDSLWEWTGLVHSTVDPNGWVGANWANWIAATKRNSMTNIVLYDSLPFVLSDSTTGTYTFQHDNGHGGFFWLDNRGFGNEPHNGSNGSNHNFGFAMEMHRQFTYKGNEYFNFSGDDDVWVFINGKLAIDLGGVHGQTAQAITLNAAFATTYNLIKGHTYWFDMFYNERHTTQANCVITTNILTPTHPNKIIITTGSNPPADTSVPSITTLSLTAGQCATFHAWVFDDTGGLRTDWDTSVTWAVVDTMGDTLAYHAKGDTNQLCVHKAFGCATVYLTFTDPNPPHLQLNQTFQICVTAGAASHLSVEAQIPSPTSRYDNSITTLTMAATAAKDSVYGVLRDAYGNFVANATSLSWSVLPDGLTNVTVAAGRTALGEGVLSRVANGVDRVVATTTSGTVYADTFSVSVSPYFYRKVQIDTGVGGTQHAITTLTMFYTTDVNLYAFGQRSDDTTKWELVNAAWYLIGLGDPVPPAQQRPNSGSSWDYKPPAAGSGQMYISYSGNNDTISVLVRPGGPASVALYSDTSSPPLLTSLYSPASSRTYQAQAGSPVPLTANIFDPYTTWLASYRGAIKASLFSWQAYFAGTSTVVPAGVGSYSATTGQTVGFTPTQTDNTIDLVVTFLEGSNLFRDTVRIYVTPSPILHVVIEHSSDSTVSPHADNRYSPVLSGSDTVDTVYAILRDQYQNFAGYATSATWLSRAPTYVGIAAGPKSGTLGQGVVRRDTSASATVWVLTQKAAYTDSVQVTLQSIFYRALRIVDAGLNNVDSLRMGTDSSVTLQVLGQRSDNGAWVLVPVTWSTTGTLRETPGVPGSQTDHWQINPDTAGSGNIIVSKVSGLNTITDTVRAIFTHGKPNSIELWHTAGAPKSPNTAYDIPPTVDTVLAGFADAIVAKLFDSKHVWLSEYDSASAAFAWQQNLLAGTGVTGTLSPATGNRSVFTPTRAYNTVEIVAQFAGVASSGRVRFYVKPDTVDARHLVVEQAPGTNSLNAPNPFPQDTARIAATDTIVYGYAVLRDQFQNYIAAATTATWTSDTPSVVATRVTNAPIGEGAAVREASRQAKVRVTAASGALTYPFTVVLSNVTYDSLRIVNRAMVDIRNMTIRTDQDTALYALGRRSDNHAWDNIPVTWQTVGVTTSPSAPASLVDSFAFWPTSNGSGRIVISLTTGGHTMYDTTFVSFTPGLPDHIILFPLTSAPFVGANQPYPGPTVTDNVAAGTSRQYVAKVFDRLDTNLTSYDAMGVNAPVAWNMVVLTGSAPFDTLSRRSGNVTIFSATHAYKRMYIVGTFSENGRTFSDSVQVYVGPDTTLATRRLYIESTADSTVSPNAPNPLDWVVLNSGDTIYTGGIYAMIRDRFGNFLAHSTSTQWTSMDTTVVKVAGGVPSLGQGNVFRVAINADTTWVRATNVVDTLLTYTTEVVVSNITYDSLRIVINSHGLRDVDTLRIGTDSSITLYALGYRSDTHQWDNVKLPWSAPGLVITPTAPSMADNWTIHPMAQDTGVISISYVNNVLHRTLTDSVVVEFVAGSPNRLAIYTKVGQPDVLGDTAYPPWTTVDTIHAGDSVPLVGKIFDSRNAWLSQFEIPGAPITWAFNDPPPAAGVLSPLSGFVSAFHPQDAYKVAHITANYQGMFGDTVSFYVAPGPATHLVLEASATPGLWDDNPAGGVTIGQRDTVTEGPYAILRDKFGNFVGYGQNIQWTSRDTSLVNAGPGQTNVGGGRIIRDTSGGGTTWVVARDPVTGFTDSVLVTLATVSYDSLRIVDGTGTVVTKDSVATDSGGNGAVTLMVQGLRSDNKRWEFVPANWSSSSGLSVTPAAPGSVNSWTFTPTDTGRGWVKTTLGQAVPDSVMVIFVHGKPVTLVLYPDTGAPSVANAKYQDPTATPMLSVQAGSSFPAVAKIMDHAGVWLREYQTPSVAISWLLESATTRPLGEKLADTTGYQTTFTSVHARDTARIIATFPYRGMILADTVMVTVTYGAVDHLVLEGDQNPPLYADNPLDSVTFTDVDLYHDVYAVLRDRYGNLVGSSKRTNWGNTSSDTIVTVGGVSPDLGWGRITKTYTGSDTLISTKVYAASLDYPGLSDSVTVTVVKLHYDSLRIVSMDSAGAPIGSLVMWTDDSTELQVQGRIAGRNQWVNVQAQWVTSTGLAVPDAPQWAQSWIFSPTGPDTGWIKVTRDVDSITKPCTIPVVFLRSPPSTVWFTITTQGDLHAGDTITALVTIRNKDGNVPGTFCLSGSSAAVYQGSTTLSSGSRPRDTVMTGEDTAGLNPSGQTGSLVNECFHGGVDTVRFVLYYAPYDPDSTTVLTVNVGTAQGQTRPFLLLPGPLATMRLEDQNGTPYGDSLLMRYRASGQPSDWALFVAMGYDKYGNRESKQMSLWSTTGTIPPIPGSPQGRQIYYSAGQIADNGAGWIKAQVDDTSHGVLRDSVFVTITGMLPELDSALALDMNGNGLLDHIELHFSKPVHLPLSFDPSDTANALVTYVSGDFATRLKLAQTIVYPNLGDSTVVLLGIVEDTLSTAEALVPSNYQTSWEPALRCGFGDSAFAVSNYPCVDRAGPVIVSVRKKLVSAFTRANDEVTVVFSEHIRGVGLGLQTPPNVLFDVWQKTDDTLVPMPGFLDSISGLMSDPSGADTLRFRMENGKDLMTHHYLSIRVTGCAANGSHCNSVILDMNQPVGNAPVYANRRVQVVLGDMPPSQAILIGSPGHPSTKYVPAGRINIANAPDAASSWVPNGGGVVIRFPVVLPVSGISAKVACYLKIYDIAGNLVQSGSNPDILSTIAQGTANSSIAYLDIYWNGTNEAGTPVAPGIYRYVVFLDYPGQTMDTKLLGNMGIKR